MGSNLDPTLYRHGVQRGGPGPGNRTQWPRVRTTGDIGGSSGRQDKKLSRDARAVVHHLGNGPREEDGSKASG